jgi:hypothetical protein
MKRYALKTKDGEIINTINAVSLEDAIDLFSKIKKLPKKELLDIFLVEIFIR